MVVMLGARIDVIQPQIRKVIAYLMSLPDNRQQLWLNERTGQKLSSKMLAFAEHAYQKRFNKVLSFVVIGASEDFFHLIMSVCMCENNKLTIYIYIYIYIYTEVERVQQYSTQVKVPLHY